MLQVYITGDFSIDETYAVGNLRIIRTDYKLLLKLCGNAVESYRLPHFHHLLSYNSTKFVQSGTDLNGNLIGKFVVTDKIEIKFG